MRFSKRLGLGLVLAGLAVLVVSTGGFDSIAADRGSQLDTASDRNALLGINYTEGRTVELESQDGTPGCLFNAFCYSYENRELVVLHDNTVGGGLAVNYPIEFDVDETDSNFEITNGPSYDTTGPNLAVITASFECRALFGYQLQGSGWIEMDATVTDGDTTIEVTRRINVECIAD